MSQAKQYLEKLLTDAGVDIKKDIRVLNEDTYVRVVSGGSLGLGESYVEGWWEANHLDDFFYKILLARLNSKFKLSWPVIVLYLKYLVANLQSKKRAFIIGEKHYDIGNDLYKAMLGESLAYSCGYWKKAANLDEAQFAKFDLICRKLSLKKGDRILDIGCGWGGFLKYAAENYGVSGVGVTVSKEQAVLAKDLCKGLPIEIKVQDYRTLEGTFDHIVSVGMFEHVGVKNYHAYIKKAKELLKNGGLFLLHTIGSSETLISMDPWMEKYIFPNSILPAVSQIAKAAEGFFIIEDWHNFGPDYDKTLMAWHENFVKHWPELKTKYSDRFYRMWTYYLLFCAGNFRSRNTQLWQVVLSKEGVPGGYQTVR